MSRRNCHCYSLPVVATTSVSETSRWIVSARYSSPSFTPPYSRTTMNWPLMKGSPPGIWCQKADARIQTHINSLFSRLVLLFRYGFVPGQGQRRDFVSLLHASRANLTWMKGRQDGSGDIFTVALKE